MSQLVLVFAVYVHKNFLFLFLIARLYGFEIMFR